jgi:flagellar hook-associated protein 3 FlgL
VQRPSDIATEFGTASATIQRAKARHTETKNFIGQAVDKIENSSTEEVAASILSLQTRLQASYQTTSILSRLTLTSYL